MAKKILLAEDSVTMQRVVQLTFAAEDFTVTTVSNTDEALARAREMSPDIVIADLSMPGKNGYDLCAALRREGQDTPVLLMHGSNVTFDSAKASMVRADGNIAKPFDTQAMIDKVNELMIRSAMVPVGPIESLASPIESTEDIVIDAGVPPQPSISFSGPEIARPVAPPAPWAAPVAPIAVASAPRVEAESISVSTPLPISVGDEEIMIDAEPPTMRERLPSFSRQTPTSPPPAPPPIAATPRPPQRAPIAVGAPLPSVHLPPPPAGMPLPGVGSRPAPTQIPAGRSSEPTLPADIDPAVYDAIAKISREVIERIVWEVVPDLAETIIREQLDRLIAEKRIG